MDRYIKIGDIKIGKKQKYVFEDIEGVAGGDINYQEDVFAETDGAEYSQIAFKPRNLTIKGTIIASSKEELQELKRALISACNPKKELDIYYHNGFNEYYAKGMADGMPAFAKRRKTTMDYVVYIKIPSFFWLTNSDIVTGIYTVTGRLDRNFTFPGAFSVRIDSNVVINDGEEEAFPVIVLSCETPNADPIILSNDTQNKTLYLDYTMTAGETITIDMYNRSVLSSINGSLLNHLSRTDNFWSIGAGQNVIRVSTTYITATMYHRNRYIGV